MIKKEKSSYLLRKVTVSAVFLSLALVFKLVFSVNIPLFGADGMRVGLTGIFTAFPAILFGPLYGGVVSALSDLLGALIKPSGAYIPWFTLSAFVGGFIKGLIWRLVKKSNDKYLRIAVVVIIIIVGAFGVYNTAAMNNDGVDAHFFDGVEDASSVSFEGLSLPSRIVLERAAAAKSPSDNLPSYILYTTTALWVFALLALAMVALDYLISRKAGSGHSSFRILLALVLSGLIVSTINTEILRIVVYSSWKNIAFFLLWLPRAIEEVVVCTVQAWIVALLYEVYLKQIKPRTFMRDLP